MDSHLARPSYKATQRKFKTKMVGATKNYNFYLKRKKMFPAKLSI